MAEAPSRRVYFASRMFYRSPDAYRRFAREAIRKKRAKDRAKANTGKPTKTKALQVAEPPPIRPEVLTGEGDVGERVATLGRCFADGVIHHYHLSTGHMAQMPRSDVRPETLAALRPIIKVATSGHVVPLPGFTEYFLSIRNTWIGAVGWLIEGTERRVMVRCVTAWTVGGAAKGVRWLAAELPAELDLPCCLVRLGVPLLEDPVAASLLDDAERCIGWALLPTAP